ncbi:DUF4354 family protein [Symbiopectobacterium purcellii]|uniref:DUF4354 family protein n=1 Tax=Symbiopectobacterium purcellii TaxID=2871826 RepID=UPI003F82A396
MKVSMIVATMVLAGFSFAANASMPDNIAVYATAQSNGSISIGSKMVYTKSFEVAVVKLSGDDVNLSTLCLKAYSPDNKAFRLDTVDEALTTGILKEGKPVKGIAMFASENATVLDAAVVKITDDCK